MTDDMIHLRAVVRRLAALAHDMQHLGENDMGLLTEAHANRFHYATDIMIKLVSELKSETGQP